MSSVVESAPFGHFAPSGFCALALARDAPLLRRMVRQADGVFPARRRDALAARPAGRRRSRSARACASIPPTTSRKSACCSRRNISTRRSGRCWRERLKGDFVFLDVGASVGGYALYAAGLGGPRARILGRRTVAGSVRAARLQHPAERVRQRQGGFLRARRHRRRDHAVRQHQQSGRDLGARSSAPRRASSRCACAPRSC